MKNHTHELRLHDYRKGINHVEILVKGNEQDCMYYLAAKAKEWGCGIGLLTTNCGYTVVNLKEEAIGKIKVAAYELYQAGKDALEYLNKINCCDEGDQARQRLEAAIKMAE